MLRKLIPIGLALAVCGLMQVSMATAEEQVERPMRVTASGIVVLDLNSGDWVSNDFGVGLHLGRFTDSGDGWLVWLGPVTAYGEGDGWTVAANGDLLGWHIEFTHDVETGMTEATMTITGGSGRFENASGSLSTVYPAVAHPQGGVIVFTHSYTATGTITY